MIFAVTGATGFVGQRVTAFAETPLNALTRRPQPDQPGVNWVPGDLADTTALSQLCEGAVSVVHIAGIVNAPTRAAFDAGNVAGTAAMLEAARAAGVKRFVHVSSLAAREPGLSMYGASKAEAERLVMASDLDWVIVRPPGVYGPADTEMRDIYTLAARGLYVAPPGRISLIHVDDLARALLALASGGPSRQTFEIDDGAANGYSHRDFARAIGATLGKRVRVVPLPLSMLHFAAKIGVSPRLTPDRARYIAHADWVARGGNTALGGVWTPQIDLANGVADTIAGYRARDWL